MQNVEEFELSSLICSKFRKIEEISSKVEYCTNVTNNLASGLLRTAATRIFSDPKMSFSEIIANSIDAYNKSDTIGKFGMGFISNLFWLFNHPKRYINIVSETETQFWRATIFFDNVYKLDFENIKQKRKKSNFTIITFGFPDFKDGENFYLFLKSISKFVNIDISISVLEFNGNGKLEKIYTNGIISDNKINIYINQTNKVYNNIKPGEIVFKDSASGITKEVLFNSMLVPSSSTKNMINIPLIYKDEIKRRDLNDIEYTPNISSGFIVDSPYGIVVGNVIIVPLNFNYYIDFPYTARVTVARDDILISTKEEEKILKFKINKIINISLNQGDTHEVLEALEYYKNFTDQNNIKKIISSCINKLLSSDKIILVPKMYKIYNLIKDKVAVEFKNSSIIQISYELEELFKNNIKRKLGQKNVVFVKNLGENYTFAGTNNMLFIDIDFYKSDPENCFENIILSNTTEYIKNDIIEDNDYNFIMSNYASKFKNNKVILDIYSSAYKFISNYNLEWESDKEQFGGLVDIKSFIEILTAKLDIIVKLKVSSDKISDYLSKLFNFFCVSFPKNIVYGQDTELFEWKTTWDSYKSYIKDSEIKLDKVVNITEDILDLQIELDYYAFDMDNSIFIDNILLGLLNCLPEYINELYPRVNFVELIVFTLVVLEYEMVNAGRGQNKLETNFTLDELDFIITKMRGFCDLSKLKSILMETCKPGGDDGSNIYYTTIYTPLSIIFNTLLKNRELKIYETYETSKNIKSFYLTSLINYVTENNVDINKFDWVKNIPIQQSRINSNIIDIACNTGTTKDIIPAILTELIQNSRDAIKKRNTGSSIYIDFYNYDPQNYEDCMLKCTKEMFVLTVKDDIGIPISAFTSLLIPFLSSKKVEGNYIPVGSMGTGFFNIFRQPICERVYIITTPPKTKKTYMIECIPVIKTGKIVDIKYNVSFLNKFKSGTSINIICKDDVRIEVETFLTNFMGTIDTLVVYNGKEIKNANRMIYDGKGYQIRIYDKGHCASNIQVGGIPVIELSKYNFGEIRENVEKINNINYNIVIDLNSDVKILPNQSRNRLIITDEKDEDFLIKTILDANYLDIIYKRLGSFSIHKILYGFLSRTEVDQVLPSNTKNYFSNYNFGERDYTLVSIIRKIYRKSFKVGYEEAIRTILEKYQLFDKEKKLIKGWYAYKNKENEKNKKDKINKSPNFKKFQSEILNFYVEKFWNIGYELQNKGYFSGDSFKFSKIAPKIIIKTMKEDSLHGYYKISDHLIRLNFKYVPNILRDMEKLKTIGNDDIANFVYNDLKYLFKVAKIPTTLIHELSHAWKNTDEGVHDSVLLTIKGIEEEYEFDRAASIVYNHIIQHGLFN